MQGASQSCHRNTDELRAASNLWSSAGLPAFYLEHLKLEQSPDIHLNSSFKLGNAAQTTIGLSGLSAALFHQLRTGTEQDVSVKARHAVIEFHSEAFYNLNGKPPGSIWDSIAGIYKTKDDGFVRLHTNFPHHRKGLLDILGIEDTPEVTRNRVQEALLSWNALDFEEAAGNKGMCAFAVRSFEQWDATPMAKALRETLPVYIRKIGDAPKRVVDESLRGTLMHPLQGIKVLDLSRVLAGPVAGRTLAAHGADVLLVTSPNLSDLPNLDVDTSRGKRTTQLDLNRSEDREKLTTLVGNADVFLQAYRPGGLEGKGFGVEQLVGMKGGRMHGIVCANLCAWGWEGPWKDRRGFDSLVQSATGLNIAEAEAHAEFIGPSKNTERSLKPKPFPVQALDHVAGYLLAFGINAALCKTIIEGGSWEVCVSLAAVGQWVRSLGRAKPEYAFGRAKPLPQPQSEEIRDLSVEWKQSNGSGRITAIRHAAIMSKTPVRHGREGEPGAPLVLNAHGPVWEV
ncbi:l-carnitine dehydratase bile acid-inducible protein f [Moniliophthora roreri MCA 2997]|uniref:L-carnitine dehydratase bile acid-inducible protein f n=2 Tax=Moniliophthora roreri TaxID=221103 RepID=V2WVG0_MONRO|nr:l-carnitine dehydratase bile acid-inducible protein f [Moniliophthora roreri MCA 2997]